MKSKHCTNQILRPEDNVRSLSIGGLAIGEVILFFFLLRGWSTCRRLIKYTPVHIGLKIMS